MADGIKTWLHRLGFEQYITEFVDNGIDIDLLEHLKNDDLKELGVSKLGDRKKILLAIERTDGLQDTPPNRREADEPAQDNTPEAERRHLTVMFADLVGSTELSGRLDPEDMRNVITSYQNSVAGVVARYEGFLAKFMGDGVLCYFGWPRANEDDAERAVRAGLAIISAVNSGTTPDGKSLSCRIGIATGLVIVGDLVGEGANQEAAVVGETPNLAARLQGLAQPDQLVLPQDTRNLLGSIFELEPLGVHQLKGISEPVTAYSVIGDSSRESRFAARQSGALTPIVGREQELSLMGECWSKAKSGKGQMILVDGEAGIGKSRIARAMIDTIAKDEHVQITCQCSPYHTDSAFYPIIHQMSLAAHFEPSDTNNARLDKLEKLPGINSENVSLLATLLGIDASEQHPSLKLGPAQQRAHTMNALTQLITGHARQKPLLLVFEDLHWIDPTSLELLDIALDAISDSKVLILSTARPTFEHGFGGHPVVTRFSLNRLGNEQILSIVEKLTGGKTIPDEVLQVIVNRTDGVPLFVEELTKTILESGILRDEGAKLVLDGPLETLAIPHSLHDSLMARLDRLQPVKEVAQTAACIGREFGHRLLGHISPISETELETALNGLIKAELVFRRGVPPDATYLFKHALVRDAAYESLLKDRRKHLHRKILEVLEDDPDSSPELLAHHAGVAGLTQRAIDLWEIAGKAALNRPAYEEAISHFSHAIEWIEPLANTGDLAAIERSLELHVQLGQPLIAGDGFAAKKTIQVFEKALALTEKLDSTPLYTEVIYGHWVTKYVHADHYDAFVLAQNLYKLGNESKDRTQSLIANRIFGVCLTFDGQHRKAQKRLDYALTIYNPDKDNWLADRFGQEPAIALKVYCAMNLWFLGKTRLATKHAREVEQLATKLGHVQSTCYTHAHLMIFNILSGDVREFERNCNEVARLANEHSMRFWQYYEGMFRGLLTAMKGDSQGIAYFEESLMAYENSGSRLYAGLLSVYVGWSALKLGLLDKAKELSASAERRIFKTNELPALPELFRLKAEIALAEEDNEVAVTNLKEAMALARKRGCVSYELRATIDFARLQKNRTGENKALDRLQAIVNATDEGDCEPYRSSALQILQS